MSECVCVRVILCCDRLSDCHVHYSFLLFPWLFSFYFRSQMIGPGFDPVSLELWPFLTLGASVHIMPHDVRSSPPALYRWLQAHRITVGLFATPVAETILHEQWPANPLCAGPGVSAVRPHLRVMTAGGDKLHSRPKCLPFRFDNHYGPSEATVITTFWPIPDGFKGAPPIGKPVHNTFVYVLDQYRQVRSPPRSLFAD